MKATRPDLPMTLARDGFWPIGSDPMVLVVLAIGYMVLYAPTFWDLSRTTWASSDQGHGPIILAVSVWLLYRKRNEVAALPSEPVVFLGGLSLGFGLLLYVFGRSQSIIMFEVGSQIPVLAGLLWLFKGTAAVRLAWFPLFFLVFMMPLPGVIVAALTTPLKSAVSAVASGILHSLGYPVARSGVMMTVGQYQLLVADACAGLNSMFSLEAMGLLYMNIMGYASAFRNAFLAILIVPISFGANVVRVIVLCLVTFYFGDEAGQGFVHGFAGMLLFLTALLFTIFVDTIFSLLATWRVRSS